MKAVVAQVKRRHAVLLLEDGTFVRTLNQRYRPGQQVSFLPKRTKSSRLILMAACFMIFLAGGTGLAAELLPFSYVSVDVNPSIEYTLNWFDSVIGLRAVNEDAEVIIHKLRENGADRKPIGQVISLTVDCLKEFRYLSSETGNDIVIAVASYGIKDAAGLSKKVMDDAESLKADQTLAVTEIQTNKEKVREAHKYNTTAGKLVLAEEVEAAHDNQAPLSREEWIQKPVVELLHNQNKKNMQKSGPDFKAEEKTPEKDNGQEESSLPDLLPTEKPGGGNGVHANGIPDVENMRDLMKDNGNHKETTAKPKENSKPAATPLPTAILPSDTVPDEESKPKGGGHGRQQDGPDTGSSPNQPKGSEGNQGGKPKK